MVAQHPIAEPEDRALKLVHQLQNGRALSSETAIYEIAEFVNQAGTSKRPREFAPS